jgi:GT2 family glycosyltransferase
MFDEDFFIYVEETDLCWRIWLSGFQVGYVPSSVVYHAFGRTPKLQSPRTKFLGKYHGTKNYISMILKNAGSFSLLKMLPIHVFCWMGIVGWHFVRRRVVEGVWIGKGIFYNLTNFDSIWRKRLRAQYVVRLVSDERIMPLILKRISPLYLYEKATQEGSGWRI